MAVAGMESGAISADTTIETMGKFTKYFGSVGPTCLGYNGHGGCHGSIDVRDALKVSCNYFFYELADRMGIETIDKYAKLLGLGEPTGVELYEEIGYRSNEETKTKLYGEGYGEFYAGDTILSGIGQSEHRYTPLQMAVYAASVANRGTRLAATFLNRIVSPDYTTLVYEREPKILSQVNMSEATYQAVVDGMHRVTTGGSAGRFFRDWANPYDIEVCGKTGTAEHGSGGSNHGAFICFAPMENPEIAIAVYGEKGGHGANMSIVAQAILDTYFALHGETTITASDAPVYENRVG
jgi:penicillin-binding protein 2